MMWVHLLPLPPPHHYHQHHDHHHNRVLVQPVFESMNSPSADQRLTNNLLSAGLLNY